MHVCYSQTPFLVNYQRKLSYLWFLLKMREPLLLRLRIAQLPESKNHNRELKNHDEVHDDVC